MPCVSYRAAVSDELLADRPGFRLEDIAADCSHPADSRFGAQYLGDVLVSYLNATLRRSVGAAAALAPETSELPKPVIGRNSAASDRAITRCYQTPYRPDRQVVGNVSARCAFRKRRLLTRPPVRLVAHSVSQWRALALGCHILSGAAIGPLCAALAPPL